MPDVFRTISGELESEDTDEDGIPDITETSGFRDGLGNWYYTDPENPDTDGDGLTDGEEAGVVTNVDGKIFFHVVSSPTAEDSDNDSLDDYDEYLLGTNPLNPDSDGDKLIDGLDSEPLISVTVTPKPSVYKIGRAIVLGAVFGETGIEGGSLSYLVDYEIASSPYYLVGWIGFSLVPVVGAVADARDAVQALINGDELGAALNAAGAFSGVGDAVKVGGAVGLFITKYPDKGGDVAKALGKYAFPHAPDLVKLKFLDIIFDGAATRLVNKHGNEILPDLVTLADKDVDLSKVIGVAKNGNDIRWLENGDDLRGWVHIDGRHIEGTLKEGLYTTFFPVGQTISRNGVPRTLSSVMDKKDVEDLICEAVKRGNIDPNDPYAYIFKPSDNGFNYGIDEMRVIFDSKGNIKTAYPIKGSNVWAWDPDIGGWINVI